jgi:hypothetical protein
MPSDMAARPRLDSPGRSTTRDKRAGPVQELVAKTVICALLLIVPFVYASPPDQTWIPGIYDDNDYDKVVALVIHEISASCGHTPAHIDRRPMSYPMDQPLSSVTRMKLTVRLNRGPPIELLGTSVNAPNRALARHLQASVASITVHTFVTSPNFFARRAVVRPHFDRG